VIAENFKSVARCVIAGGGQVVVDGDYAFIGHMDPPHGTSILDVSNPATPKVVGHIALEGEASHSHKVRVIHDGTIMITNLERARRGFFRKGRAALAAKQRLEKELGRDPSPQEIADAAEVGVEQVPEFVVAGAVPYDDGGIRIWDIKDKTAPKLITHVKTGSDGSHRFDVDDNYIYVSSGKEGFSGNILQIFDIGDPAKPEPVADWWVPGQNVAAGETPPLAHGAVQLHHAMRCGDELWAGCWYGGLAGIDVSDISKPTTFARYDYHPAFPHPTHTVMRPPFKIGGKDIIVCIDEEASHVRGQAHAFLWFFELVDGTELKPISTFHVAEGETPYARDGARFGAHQYQEHFDGRPLLFGTWFSAGLRAVDFSDPFRPKEVGAFIPEPMEEGRNLQTNDVEVDSRGLVYVLDRFRGLDIAEFTG